MQSVMGVNLETLRPEPSVEGYTTPGGYSCKAVKPIALAKAGAFLRVQGLMHCSPLLQPLSLTVCAPLRCLDA